MAIFYTYCLKNRQRIHNISVELDNIEEEKNIKSVELEHAHLENLSLRQKLHRYTSLKNLTENLSSTLSLEETISLITDQTRQIIGKPDVKLLYLMDKKETRGDIFDDWILKYRTPLMVGDTKKDFRFNLQGPQDQQRSLVRSLIAAPLIRENRLLGILRLDSESADAYDTDDLRLLDIISNLAAVAIVNTLLYQETEKLAITDGLTGLFVYRYFQERFDQEIQRGLWANSCFSFLMLDIDDFKSYNDRYGHIAGDIVLKKIAKLIVSTCNPGDIVARYGGEEFAVLLVDTPKQLAVKITEAIREKIEKKRFILRHQATEVKISGGVAAFPEDGRVKESLINKADSALYKAKLEGKNRICTI